LEKSVLATLRAVMPRRLLDDCPHPDGDRSRDYNGSDSHPQSIAANSGKSWSCSEICGFYRRVSAFFSAPSYARQQALYLYDKTLPKQGSPWVGRTFAHAVNTSTHTYGGLLFAAPALL
jgi:hypothetical protein